MIMHALAASCEELRARTGNPPLNGFFMHNIYLRQALMHVWVQQSAEHCIYFNSFRFLGDTLYSTNTVI